MTRICMYCKKVIGEKCGKCGSLDVAWNCEWEFWQCLVCGFRWLPGSEPATHGICKECWHVAK
jgi:hypothetical protein